MTKFHVSSKTGEAGECSSVKGKCPFGGLEAHYASAQDARVAFELSMAGKELKSSKKTPGESEWSDWGTYPSGALLKKFGATTGFIARGSQNRYLAYGKNYNADIGPASYLTEEDALADVAETFREKRFALGDTLPSTLGKDLFTPHHRETYALRDRDGLTELAVIQADNIIYFRGLKAVERENAYAELKAYYPEGKLKNKTMKNNEVYWTADSQQGFVYIEHANAIFRGDFRKSVENSDS